MYGYVTPIKEQMSCSDFQLYRAYYCGICKATGKAYGQLPRFTTNYDIVFLSVLLSDFTMQEVSFECGGCVLNPFKKKVTVKANELLDKIVDTNIILSYYKLVDGVRDGDGAGKRALKGLLNGAYKKAARRRPETVRTVSVRYEQLFKLESEGTAGIDRAADPFACLLRDLAAELLGDKATDDILGLCYNVGKFVYLADALDDVGEDSKKKRYNPFLALYKDYTTRSEFFTRHKDDLTFILASTVNRAIECFNAIDFSERSRTLLQNVMHKGLRDKTEQLFASEKKLPKPKI